MRDDYDGRIVLIYYFVLSLRHERTQKKNIIIKKKKQKTGIQFFVLSEVQRNKFKR